MLCLISLTFATLSRQSLGIEQNAIGNYCIPTLLNIDCSKRSYKPILGHAIKKVVHSIGPWPPSLHELLSHITARLKKRGKDLATISSLIFVVVDTFLF